MVASLEGSGWQIRFSSLKAHGNKLADKVAKEAAHNTATHYEYNRTPKSYLWHRAAEEAKQKWHAEWTAGNKAAETREYFPSLQNRLGTKLTITAKLAALVTGNGKQGNISSGST